MAKILGVDDDEVSRLLMGRLLQDAGHEIVYATDGEVALERITSGDFEIIVTDLAMPGLNGLRLIQAIKESRVRTPIVAVSGRNAEQLVLAEDFGAAATLTKPLDRRMFVSEVQRVLSDYSWAWDQPGLSGRPPTRTETVSRSAVSRRATSRPCSFTASGRSSNSAGARSR